MKSLIVASLAMLAGMSVAHADQTTAIHHSDGTTTTVTTDRQGTQAITPGHGGGQFGQGIPHEEVVKQYTRPDSQIEH
jgi:hypothetical protein